MPLACTVWLTASCPAAFAGWFADLWVTPDQRAQRQFDRDEYASAAREFTDPMRRGVAHYRAAAFDDAAAEFGRVGTPEGAFNQGNAYLMRGKYADAIASYDRALDQRPDWQAAEDNRAIAVVRMDRMAPPEDDAGGTGAMLEADEIVFDESGQRSGGQQVTADESGAQMSDEEIQALWLRRVQTKPADFLRTKFAYQAAAANRDATSK